MHLKCKMLSVKSLCCIYIIPKKKKKLCIKLVINCAGATEASRGIYFKAKEWHTSQSDKPSMKSKSYNYT